MKRSRSASPSTPSSSSSFRRSAGKRGDERALFHHQARDEKAGEGPLGGLAVESRLGEEGEKTLMIQKASGEIQGVQQEERIVMERSDEVPGDGERVGGDHDLPFDGLEPHVAVFDESDVARLPEVLQVRDHRYIQPAGAAAQPASERLGNLQTGEGCCARERISRFPRGWTYRGLISSSASSLGGSRSAQESRGRNDGRASNSAQSCATIRRAAG